MRKLTLNWSCALITVIVLFSACKKEWLDAKPDKSLVVPSTVADYQALLDDNQLLNGGQPSLTILGDGDFYLTDANFNARAQTEKSVYMWAANSDNFYNTPAISDWSRAYARILISNIVLEGLRDLKNANYLRKDYNNAKGSALFFRSFDFYNLSQEFCKLYSNASANIDLGLPLRLSANINLEVKRSSVQQTYDQIIKDLIQALPLLPATPAYTTRPSKAAVFGLLSRVYLSQQDYKQALLYSDSCLQLQSALLNYNDLNPAASYPISPNNKEVIFHADMISYASFSSSRLIVDPKLYQSYATNDLRSIIYFVTVAGNKSFKGSYNQFNFFNGLATDEMYLIRSECYARSGNTSAAMNDLNTLLKTRWKNSVNYPTMVAMDAEDALKKILAERRKELCFRNLRWTDLRRLNTDSRFQTTITRTVAGVTYTLEPNSLRYVLPLDNNQVILGALQQNPR
jgi:hypothetical protein